MPKPIPSYCDSIEIPEGPTVIIYPISYKLAREFKAHVAELAGQITNGAKATADCVLDDTVSDLVNRCCKPMLTELEFLPLYTAAEIYARWMKLNFTEDKFSFTAALLEETIEKLVGRKISLRQIWSNFVSLAGILAPTSTTANAAGPIPDGAFRSSISDLPLPQGSSVVLEPTQ